MSAPLTSVAAAIDVTFSRGGNSQLGAKGTTATPSLVRILVPGRDNMPPRLTSPLRLETYPPMLRRTQPATEGRRPE